MTIYDEDKIPEEINGVSVIQDIIIAMDCLSKGQTITRYEFGDSMTPILTSGQFCNLVPIKEGEEIKQGDCVFAVVNNSVGTHMVWMISESNGKKYYCIATTSGTVIGWTDNILAKAYGIPHFVHETYTKTKLKEPRANRPRTIRRATLDRTTTAALNNGDFDEDEDINTIDISQLYSNISARLTSTRGTVGVAADLESSPLIEQIDDTTFGIADTTFGDRVLDEVDNDAPF